MIIIPFLQTFLVYTISESESCLCSCFASGENFSELETIEQSGGEEVEEVEEEEEEEEGGEAKRSKMAKREVQPTNHVGGRNLTK